MDYQEKVCTKDAIKELYDRVIQMPHVKRYRGYDAVNSYGWDEIIGDYVYQSGDQWFDNPGYYPECGISDEELKEELKRGLDPKPRILDSGNRREFETGAVRDICEGKGRCDLLPLDVVAYYYDHGGCADELSVFHSISRFQETGNDHHLHHTLDAASHIFSNSADMLLEVAKHFEEGCKKYGDNNWQKGIPTHCYIDSAVRHYLKYLRGDKDEPHDRAFCWNILCCIWTCIHKPELNDYAKKEEKDEQNEPRPQA